MRVYYLCWNKPQSSGDVIDRYPPDEDRSGTVLPRDLRYHSEIGSVPHGDFPSSSAQGLTRHSVSIAVKSRHTTLGQVKPGLIAARHLLAVTFSIATQL